METVTLFDETEDGDGESYGEQLDNNQHQFEESGSPLSSRFSYSKRIDFQDTREKTSKSSMRTARPSQSRILAAGGRSTTSLNQYDDSDGDDISDENEIDETMTLETV